MTIDLSEPKIVGHLFRIVLFGAAAYWLFVFSNSFESDWKYLLFLPVWLFAAGCIRNLHALLVFPKFLLTPHEIKLRYWKDNSRWLGMFLPSNRVVDESIPWSLYYRCETIRVTQGSDWFANSAFLYITTLAKIHEIGADVFARNVSDLMRQVGHYYDSLGDSSVPTEPATVRGQTLPLVEVSDGRNVQLISRSRTQVAQFNSRRFVKPITYHRHVNGQDSGKIIEWGFAVFLFPFLIVMFGAMGCMAILGVKFVLSIGGQGELTKALFDEVELFGGEYPLFALIGAPGGVAIGLIWFVWSMVQDASKSKSPLLLALTADGFGLADQVEDVRITPWDEVLCARVMTSQRTTTYDGGDQYTSTTTYLEIDLRNGDIVRLHDSYGRTFEELKELIDPTTARLHIARALTDAGVPIEEAAGAAGLPRA